MLVAGILGALFLVCVGCGGGVFYFVIRPMGETFNELAEKTDPNARPTNPPDPAATPTGDDTPASPKSTSPPPVATLAPDDLSRDHAKYKDQWEVAELHQIGHPAITNGLGDEVREGRVAQVQPAPRSDAVRFVPEPLREHFCQVLHGVRAE